jgi:hypothetical protein
VRTRTTPYCFIGNRISGILWQPATVSGGSQHQDRDHWLSAVLHPAPRNLAVASALFLLPWAVALVQVLRHHHLDDGAVGLVATFSLGLPALWLALVGYLEASRSALVSELTMVQMADQLALAVGKQWEDEAAIRRLNDPYPLPVSWDSADPSLTDSWDSLVKLASSGAGWSALCPETWASGPDGLAGEGGDLVDVLARVPTRRLIVLGEPGAGKTMLLVRLVLDLLARRKPGEPVPILASVASWNAASQSLRDWLATQLMINHSALAAAPPAGLGEPTWAAALLASGLILPILDGLDEIPEGALGWAISRINDALRSGEPLVTTCRSQQYREAVRPTGGPEVTLRGTAAVKLRPLDAAVVRSYLCDDAAGPVARARWDPVFAVLGTDAPAGQALTTPLMVALARTIYDPRPGSLARTPPDPAELRSPVLADRMAVESLLFDGFIPAAYQNEPTGHWTEQDAQSWFVFLARHLERTIGAPDLAWWQLPQAIPRIVGVVGSMTLVGVVAIVVTGAAAAVAESGETISSIAGFGALVVTLATFPAAVGYKRLPPPSHAVFRRLSYRIDIVVAAGAGVVGGVLATVGFVPGVKGGLGVAIGAGVVAMVVFLIYDWSSLQKGAPLDTGSTASPQAVLARDRGAAIFVSLARSAGPAVFAGLLVMLRSGVANGAVTGIAVWIIFAAWIGLMRTPWPLYEIARIWLALHHRLPWRLMGFLTDAHTRGVLRQEGAVYQFRHIELQHRLATRPSESTGGS